MFGLQSAVDVLVTGTYSRLPLCIKDKIIPSLTLTDKEKTDTLNKLTSLIEQRLVLSKIPIKYKNIEIGKYSARKFSVYSVAFNNKKVLSIFYFNSTVTIL